MLERYNSREEWLRARRIGSSDVAALLGLSSYATPYDVWDRLVHGVTVSDLTAEQARGIRLEPRVIATYAQRTGYRVRPTVPHSLYRREDWSTSTPDAEVDGPVDLLEVKTDRNAARWGDEQEIEQWSPELERVVRVDYYLQVQHQLWTVDARAADLAVLVPGEDPFLPELRVYRIRRDDELVERLVARLRDWWARHVVTRDPPPLDGEAATRALARVERTGARRATPAEVELAERYLAAAEGEKAARDTKRAISRELVASAGTARTLELPAGRVVIVQGTSAAQLDEGELLEDRPDLAPVLERYRRPGAAYAYPRISKGR